jgi:hypothetical protein
VLRKVNLLLDREDFWEVQLFKNDRDNIYLFKMDNKISR